MKKTSAKTMEIAIFVLIHENAPLQSMMAMAKAERN